MELLKTFNEENVTADEPALWRHRRAVRVVIFDNENKIAFIFARNRNYYELPGGGVEEGETLEQAAVREAKEEAGCDIEIEKPLGRTLEMRKGMTMVNESFGFVGKMVGEKGKLNLAADEIEEEMEVIWVSIEEAINLIEESPVPSDLYDRYVAQRDLTFLRTVLDVRKDNF